MNKSIELYAWATSNLHHLGRQARTERGQGTVEYVGIVLVVAAIVIAIIGAAGGFGSTIGDKISAAISGAIDKVVKALP